MAMRGRVNASREATVELALGSELGSSVVVEAVVDTGFTGYLTLPPSTIAELRLRPIEVVRAQLADGSFADMPTYLAAAMWHGIERRIAVCAAEGGPLLGMLLLYGSRLTVDAIDGGDVAIEEL